MPVLVATITPNPGQMEAVETALTAVIPQVHAEDGCELYALHRGSDRLVLIEKWRDDDALAAHRSGSALQTLGQSLAGLVAGGSDVQVLEAVPAGDGGKGQV